MQTNVNRYSDFYSSSKRLIMSVQDVPVQSTRTRLLAALYIRGHEYLSSMSSVVAHSFARNIATVSVFVFGIALTPFSRAIAQEAAIVRESDQLSLRPGDRIQIKIWREPDLSGEFTVDESGTVVFPKIGTVMVGQLPIDSLKGLLTVKYSSSLRNPSVDVTVFRRISVLGSVRNPGLYYADQTVSIAGAIAIAGGVVQDGDRKTVELVRNGDKRLIRANNADMLRYPVRSGDEIRIPERSWISRNTALVASTITAAAVVFAALIRP